jgi:hypothetical protein
MTRSRQTADWGSRAGLAKIVPSSVAVGSGTGSADSLGTVTLSGASTVSLNDVFSATYKNYLIQFYGTQSVGNVAFIMRLRVSGADNSNATYNTAGIRYNSDGSTTTTGVASENATSFTLVGGFNRYGAYNINFFEPFSTQYTGIISDNTISDGVGTAKARRTIMSGIFDATTSFTGFTLIPNSGTLTGTISVYGYTQ